jgi:hypothetical protein
MAALKEFPQLLEWLRIAPEPFAHAQQLLEERQVAWLTQGKILERRLKLLRPVFN